MSTLRFVHSCRERLSSFSSSLYYEEKRMSSFRDSSGSFHNTSLDDAVTFAHTLPASSSAPVYPTHRAAPSALPDLTNEPLSAAPLPNDLLDRQRLMRHITYLSSVAQRLQLELTHYQQSSGSIAGHDTSGVLQAAASQELQRQFDPIVAETQIRRLDDTIAQQSLMREADAKRCDALERELERMRRDQDALVEKMDHMESEKVAAMTWEQVAYQAQARVNELSEELEQCRHNEARMDQEMRRMRRVLKLQFGESSALDVDVSEHDSPIVEPTTVSVASDVDAARLQLLFLEMDEIAARQDLFITDMFFQPLRVALEAALVYQTEATRLRDEDAIRSAVVPSADADVPGMSVPAGSSSHDRSMEEQQSLALHQEIEAYKQQNILLDAQVQRLERALEGERDANRRMASAHASQLQDINDLLTAERHQYLERLAGEVQRAFRDGMLRERLHRKQRRELRRAAASGLSNTSQCTHASSSPGSQEADTTQTTAGQ